MSEYKATKAIVSMLLVTMMVGCVAITAVSADWATFQEGNDRNGYTTNAPPFSQSNSWSAFTGTDPWEMAGIDVTPIVGDGQVYAVDYNGAVYAFDLNGNPQWVNNAWVGMNSYFELSTPAYNNEVLYVAVSQNYFTDNIVVRAINTNNGNDLWKVTLGGYSGQTNTPVTYDNGYIYFGTWTTSGTGTYFQLNANNGAIVNTFETTDAFGSTDYGYYWAGAAVIGNYLVFGDEGGNVISLNKNTMAYVGHSAAPSSSIRSSICYADGDLFFTSNDGTCYRVDFSIGVPSLVVWTANIGTSSTSTPAVYDGRVYVGTGGFTGGNLLCLNAATGASIWTYSATGGVQSSPVVYDDDGTVYIYFTTNEAAGSVYCIDGSSADVWDFTPAATEQNYVLQGVAISDGKVFFGNDSGYLFALW